MGTKFKVRSCAVKQPEEQIVEFFLIEEAGHVRLKAKSDQDNLSWYILDVRKDGTIRLHGSVSPRLGLQLDTAEKVKVV